MSASQGFPHPMFNVQKFYEIMKLPFSSSRNSLAQPTMTSLISIDMKKVQIEIITKVMLRQCNASWKGPEELVRCKYHSCGSQQKKHSKWSTYIHVNACFLQDTFRYIFIAFFFLQINFNFFFKLISTCDITTIVKLQALSVHQIVHAVYSV